PAYNLLVFIANGYGCSIFFGFDQAGGLQGGFLRLFGAVAQNGKELPSGLLLGKDPTAEISLLVPVDQYVFWMWDQAVLQSPESPYGLLIGTGIEKTDVQWLVLPELGKVDGIHVLLRVVIIVTVTGQPPKQDPFVFLVPAVDRQGDEPFADGPGIGHGGDEGRIDHVPFLPVVLLFLVEDLIDGPPALPDGKTPEFGEDVRDVHPGFGTGLVDLVDDLIHDIVVIVIEGQGILDGKAPADVQAVQGGAHLFQVDVHLEAFQKLVPIIGGVPDAGIDEKMQHFQLHLGVVPDGLVIEGHDVLVPDAQAGGIELEFGLLLRGDPDAYLEVPIDGLAQEIDLFVIVDDRHAVPVAAVDQPGNVLYVLVPFEAVAYHIGVLAYL